MKNLFLICGCFAIVSAFAQDTKQATMEKRARELHSVIGKNDKETWKKFMKDNYTKSFLERPVKTSIKTTEKESSSSASVTSTADTMEDKLKIFERLHHNFADSKIVSLKPVDEKIEMIIENASHMKGIFSIAFENKKPYLIDGIRAEMDQR
jgi:hypothetical protein